MERLFALTVTIYVKLNKHTTTGQTGDMGVRGGLREHGGVSEEDCQVTLHHVSAVLVNRGGPRGLGACQYDTHKKRQRQDPFADLFKPEILLCPGDPTSR